MLEYNPLTLKHFFSPCGLSEFSLEQSPHCITVGQKGSTDVMQLKLLLNEKGLVAQMQFKALGPPHLIACLSWICEFSMGKTKAALEQLHFNTLIDIFEIPKARAYLAIMAVDVLQQLLARLK